MLVRGFRDGFVVVLMINNRRNIMKVKVNFLKIEDIFGFNLGIYLIVLVLLRKFDILKFLVILDEVKL